MTQLEFDLEAAMQARDAGIVTVVANGGSWHHAALLVVAALPPGWTGIGEDIRAAVVASDVGEPHSPNAWGGLTQAAMKKGLLELTGRRLPMRAVKSHARKSDEYFRTSRTLNGESA